MKYKIKLITAKEILEIASQNRLTGSKKLIGNPEKQVLFVSNSENSDKDTLTFYTGQNKEVISKIDAGILIVNEGLIENIEKNECKSDTLIFSSNPLFLFVKIVNMNYSNTFIGHTEKVFPGVKKAPYVYIEDNVNIGDGTEIYPFVSIYSNTMIGENCRIQSSTVIGSIGMGYASDNNTFPERFVHLGQVIIGNNVDIGANTTIVRGILQNTYIGDGTKIGNHVNIGHNVTIGKNCFISSGVVLCGSVTIKDGCWIAPGVKVLNKVTVGENTQLGIGCVVSKDTEPDSLYLGYPAKRIGKRK